MEIKRKFDRFTVILSDVVSPDSNVNIGGGTERTKEIQSVLDLAVERGGLHLIVDGAYYTDTLKVHSHTTIECVNESCGFFLKDHVTRSLIVNANCRPNGERLDEDIHFIGGTYNFNCTKQEHHVEVPEGTDDVSSMAEYGNTGFRIFGVKNFSLYNVVLKDQRTYALACGNAEYVHMENVRIELPNIMFAQNQDGLHFFGESRFITLRNICGCAGDDLIAFACDELDGVSSITDVLVDGVKMNDSDQGIRLLSHGKGMLDRVIIRNVTGTYKSYGFFINPWVNPQYKEDERYGHIGSITIENVDVKQQGRKYDYTRPMLFRLGGVIDTLRLFDIHFVNSDCGSDFMQIGSDYIFFEEKGNDCKTQIKNLLLKDIHIEKNEKLDTRGIVIKESAIDNLIIDGLLTDVTPIETDGGKVKNLFVSNDYAKKIDCQPEGVDNLIRR